MSRALVLGGGGPVGIGWESGLLVGLQEAGIKVGDADLILGTSAGSVVGGLLSLGVDLRSAVELVAGPLPMGDSSSGEGGGPEDGIAQLMNAVLAATAETTDPIEVRRRLGEISKSADTADEDTFVSLFAAAVQGLDWPANYACTAIDVDSGELQVWDKDAGAPLERAIASSCSVPAIFPPVTINGKRYMDGGMKTAMNTDVAAGHDAVITVSCFALELPEGMSDPVFDAMKGETDKELAAVRAAGKLEVVTPGPEMLDISGWGMFLMDPERAKPAFEAGLRQATVEADRLQTLWG